MISDNAGCAGMSIRDLLGRRAGGRPASSRTPPRTSGIPLASGCRERALDRTQGPGGNPGRGRRGPSFAGRCSLPGAADPSERRRSMRTALRAAMPLAVAAGLVAAGPAAQAKTPPTARAAGGAVDPPVYPSAVRTRVARTERALERAIRKVEAG